MKLLLFPKLRDERNEYRRSWRRCAYLHQCSGIVPISLNIVPNEMKHYRLSDISRFSIGAPIYLPSGATVLPVCEISEWDGAICPRGVPDKQQHRNLVPVPFLNLIDRRVLHLCQTSSHCQTRSRIRFNCVDSLIQSYQLHQEQ